MKKSLSEQDRPIKLSGRSALMSERFAVGKRKTHISIIYYVKSDKMVMIWWGYQHNKGVENGWQIAAVKEEEPHTHTHTKIPSALPHFPSQLSIKAAPEHD